MAGRFSLDCCTVARKSIFAFANYKSCRSSPCSSPPSFPLCSTPTRVRLMALIARCLVRLSSGGMGPLRESRRPTSSAVNDTDLLLSRCRICEPPGSSRFCRRQARPQQSYDTHLFLVGSTHSLRTTCQLCQSNEHWAKSGVRFENQPRRSHAHVPAPLHMPSLCSSSTGHPRATICYAFRKTTLLSPTTLRFFNVPATVEGLRWEDVTWYTRPRRPNQFTGSALGERKFRG